MRHNNQLAGNLPQLQNLIKRDPASYHEEFKQQLDQLNGLLQIYETCPEQPNKSIEELIMFIAQVAQCYPEDLKTYPQQLIDLLEKHNTQLDNEMRMGFCRALILLRNKQLVEPQRLLEVFFTLLRCQDKALREFLENHIVTDIKNLNTKHRNMKVNNQLQNFMYKMVNDPNTRAAKMSLDIMVELYKKNIWNDAKTVNVIANACFSKIVKVSVTALKFFLGKDPDEKDSDDSDSENEIDPKEVMLANKVNKKTRKREKQLTKVKKLVSKAKKKKSQAPVFNFSAIQLIHDPQGMAEKLFRQLESSTKRFEIKLMTLDVISRLIGLHDLFLFNFYPYLQRFIQPHQREVTRILQFTAQASHELVPPDVIEPVLKTIANNFVTERNSSDVMAIGLNAIREVCARCPLSMSEDLLRDLAMYKNYRDRSVMMAARSLIGLFRQLRPDLLHKRDRGRPTDGVEDTKAKEYGEIGAKDFVPGAEVLLEKESSSEFEIESGDEDGDSEEDDSDWVDVSHSEDEAEAPKLKGKELKAEEVKAKREQAQKVSLERLLTDDDFKRIEAANIRKQIPGAQGKKRKLDETDIAKSKSGDLVKLGDIENIYKKRKHDKAARIASVRAGQTDRDKFGYKDRRQNPDCSRTNRERKKKKNFQMIKHKVKGKVKRSFKDKQIALRNHLVKMKKMR